MVFHCRCFSLSFRRDEEEIENETTTQVESSTTQFFYTAYSHFNPSVIDPQVKASVLSNLVNKTSNLRVFKLAELRGATTNFCGASKIGEGGFGVVYQGVIKSLEHPFRHIKVALKRSHGGLQAKISIFRDAVGDALKSPHKGHKQWLTEVNFLGVVQHPNLVKLVGHCAEDDERILVYEFMHNGSVADHLYTRSKAPLSWTMRLKVAQQAARGLAYLHGEMAFQIIYRDFKSSNILLDNEWNVKLSDFGLARLGPEEGHTHVSTKFVGTMAYAAPEYIHTRRLTSMCDVWSYGMFLYELITGRRPFDRSRPKNEQKLLEWVQPYAGLEKFKLIIDPRLEGNYSLESAHGLSFIANRCLSIDPKSRPKMSEVLEMVNHLTTGVPLLAPPLTGLVSVVTIEPNMVFTHVKTTHKDMKNEGKKGCSEVQRKESSCFSRICCLP